MRKYIIICDRCKKQTVEPVVIKLGDGIDLCTGCKEVFDSWIGARLAEWCDGTPLAKPIKEETAAEHIANWDTRMKAKGRKIDIDYDKACALRRAGWSYDKIADELNCGQSTIYRKLHQEGYYEAYLNGARMGGNNDEGND